MSLPLSPPASSQPMAPPSSRGGFVRAFLSSALGTALSRVLGLMREQAIGAFIGPGAATDAFYVAFTVPNTFRRFVADEGLTGALVPAVARAEAEEDEEAARALADRVFTVLLAANLVLCVAGMLGADLLVQAFAYAFTQDAEKYALAVSMTRWLFPFLAMVSLVSLMEGLLNHRGHFFAPKIAPGLVSLGVVLAVALFSGMFAQPVWAVVAGVLAGGVVHVLVNVPVLVRLWGPLRIRGGLQDERLRGVLRELGKVVVIGLFAQINLLVLRQLAAYLGDGAVTHYWYANRVVDLAQGVIAVAIGSALLPGLSANVAQQDWEGFQASMTRAYRLAGFTLLPAATVLLAFARPTVAMMFRVGKFSAADVLTTAGALQLLVPFMLAVAGVNIVKKVYFSLEDRNTLLWVGAVGVATTGVLGWLLVGPLGLLGLALALSIATALQLVLYLVLLRRRLGAVLGLNEAALPLLKMVLCCVPMGVWMWWAASLGAWEQGPLHLGNWLAYAVGGAGAAALYAVCAAALGIEELQAVTSRLARRFKR